MIHDELLRALRERGGRATLGDLIASTALPAPAIREAILPALSRVGGHLTVDEHGEIIYRIDRRRVVKPEISRLARFLSALGAFAKAVFYTGLSVVLIAYFVLYVLLIIAAAVAAIAAAARGGDCDCDCGDCGGCGKADCGGCGDCCGGSCNGCGDSCFACFTCGSERKRAKRSALRTSQRERRARRSRWRETRREHRRERRKDRIVYVRNRLGLSPSPAHLGFGLEPDDPPENPPPSRAVHAFVFGPPPEVADSRARERNLLAFAQAHDGRVTASDAVSLTGLPLDDADALLLDLAARFEGDVTVTDEGVIVYTFDRLLVSATERQEVLNWVAAQGGSVSVSAAARYLLVPADQARARMQHLAALVDGEVEHGETTIFTFPPDARARLNELAARADASRDYTYVWERLERAPRVLGVPEGKRGWVIGFNSLNLALSGGMSVAYASGESVLAAIFDMLWGPDWEPMALGYVPFLFSASVFLIPLGRAMAIAIGNRARLVRNARAVILLALFHALEEDDDKVCAAELKSVLGVAPTPELHRQLTAALEGLVRELEGSIDVEAGTDTRGGFTYTFPRVHRELHAIEHERLAVDLDALALTEVAYDTETSP